MGLAKDFLVGSSWPATIISMLYIGSAYIRTPPEKHPIHFQYIAWVLPILFGLTNALVGVIIPRTTLTMILVGATFGFFLSNVGIRIYQMSTKIFGFSKDRTYVPIPIALVLYAIIWGVVIHQLNQL